MRKLLSFMITIALLFSWVSGPIPTALAEDNNQPDAALAFIDSQQYTWMMSDDARYAQIIPDGYSMSQKTAAMLWQAVKMEYIDIGQLYVSDFLLSSSVISKLSAYLDNAQKIESLEIGSSFASFAAEYIGNSAATLGQSDRILNYLSDWSSNTSDAEIENELKSIFSASENADVLKQLGNGMEYITVFYEVCDTVKESIFFSAAVKAIDNLQNDYMEILKDIYVYGSYYTENKVVRGYLLDALEPKLEAAFGGNPVEIVKEQVVKNIRKMSINLTWDLIVEDQVRKAAAWCIAGVGITSAKAASLTMLALSLSYKGGVLISQHITPNDLLVANLFALDINADAENILHRVLLDYEQELRVKPSEELGSKFKEAFQLYADMQIYALTLYKDNVKAYNETSFVKLGLMFKRFFTGDDRDYEQEIAAIDELINDFRSFSWTYEEASTGIDEDDLRKMLSDYTSETVVHFVADDYDKDGDLEAFAITGYETEDGVKGNVYFIDENGVQDASDYASKQFRQERWGILTPEVWELKDCRLFVTGFWISQTNYYVQTWKVKESELSSVYINTDALDHVRGNLFSVHPNVFDGASDGSGRTDKSYFLFWDGENLIEYGGVKTDRETLDKIPGLSPLLERLESRGCNITSAFLRSNGVIHINYRDHDGWGRGGYSNRNITIMMIDGHTSLVNCFSLEPTKNMDDAIYSGIYEKSSGTAKAEYPNSVQAWIDQFITTSDNDAYSVLEDVSMEELYAEEPYTEEQYDTNEDSAYSPPELTRYRSINDVPTDGYILPSNERYLTDDDVLALPKAMWGYARNEIFARYGRPFTRNEYRKYFSGREWYRVDPSYNIHNEEPIVSPMEWENAQLILRYENEG